MRLKKITLRTLILPLFFIGCASQDEVYCYLPKTTLSSNSPVLSGESILLKTTISEDELTTYLWTGPNGFQSTEFNPVILNATPEMSGDYKLIASKGICNSDEVTTNVSVILNTVTCTQTNKFFSYSEYNPTNITNIYLNYSGLSYVSSNDYRIYGGGGSFRVYLTFKGNKKPLTGIYTIVNNSTLLSSDTAHAKLDFTGSTYNYYALNGTVLVQNDAVGNTVLKFCNVPFGYNTNTTTDIVGSTMFTVEK